MDGFHRLSICLLKVLNFLLVGPRASELLLKDFYLLLGELIGLLHLFFGAILHLSQEFGQFTLLPGFVDFV